MCGKDYVTTLLYGKTLPLLLSDIFVHKFSRRRFFAKLKVLSLWKVVRGQVGSGRARLGPGQVVSDPIFFLIFFKIFRIFFLDFFIFFLKLFEIVLILFDSRLVTFAL